MENQLQRLFAIAIKRSGESVTRIICSDKMASCDKLNFFKEGLEHHHYILLLGQTGSGKTTLLNLIINFFFLNGQISGLDEIQEYVPHSARLKSDTKECTQYNLSKYVPSLNCTIIDTPGLSDTGGKENDNSNKNKIVCMLKELPHINCIFVVLNGSVTRLSSGFEKALWDITDFLPKRVYHNMVVIFTHQKLIDVNESLKEEIQKIVFPTENGHFGVNNKFGPLIETRRANKTYPQKEVEGFEHSFKTLTEVFSTIIKFDQIPASEMIELSTLSEEFESKLIEYRKLVLKKEQTEIRVQQLEEWMRKNQTKQDACIARLPHIKTAIVSTADYNTMCLAEGCLSSCHTPCLYTGMFRRNVRNCVVFRDGNCSVCAHPPSQHLSIKCKYEKRDNEASRQFENDIEDLRAEREIFSEELSGEGRSHIDKACYALRIRILMITAKLQTLTLKYSSKSVITENKRRKLSINEADFHKDSLFSEFESILRTKEIDLFHQEEWARTILEIKETEEVTIELLKDKKLQALKNNPDNSHFKMNVEIAQEILLTMPTGELSPENESQV